MSRAATCAAPILQHIDNVERPLAGEQKGAQMLQVLGLVLVEHDVEERQGFGLRQRLAVLKERQLIGRGAGIGNGEIFCCSR